jgi:hypothetical protein
VVQKKKKKKNKINIFPPRCLAWGGKKSAKLFDVVTDHSTRLVIVQRRHAPGDKGAFPLHDLVRQN